MKFCANIPTRTLLSWATVSCEPKLNGQSSIKALALTFIFWAIAAIRTKFFPALDAFVLTSKNEANPVSILEALACGVPVAAPHVGSISETVLHDKTGLLTTPLDPLSTADAVIRLLGNAAWSRQLGLQGRFEVENFWSLDAMVEGYQHLLGLLYNSKAKRLGLPKCLGDFQAVENLDADACVPPAPGLKVFNGAESEGFGSYPSQVS